LPEEIKVRDLVRVRTTQGVSVGVAAQHEVDVAALLEGRIGDRLQAAHRPRLGTLEDQLFTILHQMICYSKLLKYRKENVRPQSLSGRQDAQSGHSFPLLIRGRNPADCGHSWQIVRTTDTGRGPISGRFSSLSAYFLWSNRTTAILGTDVDI
jgi:hypothetical protein